MRQPPKLEGYFCVGVVVAAHGIKGEVTIKPFIEVPEDFVSYGDLVDSHGSLLTFSNVRVTSKGLIARMDGVNSRNDAEARRKTYIYASENMRPELDETDAYLDDLLGMDVQREDGSSFGKIRGHFDNGAHLVLTIKHPEPGHKDILIPFVDDMVAKVDHESKTLVVTDFADQMAQINA